MEPFKRGHRASVQMTKPTPGHLHHIRVESNRSLRQNYSSDDDSSSDDDGATAVDMEPDNEPHNIVFRKRAKMLISTSRIARSRTAPLSSDILHGEVEAEVVSKPPSHKTMIKAHLKDQLRDDLFVGISRKRKVVPQCKVPSNDSDDNNVSVEEKVDCVVGDPKFGMFSFFYYHVTTGRKNKELTERNVVYCSHVFSFWSALPLIVFLSQWIMYVALLIYIYNHSSTDMCPNTAPLDQKLLLFGISLLYYVKSFGMWDNLVDRSRRKRMIPSNSYIVIIDSLQEYGFNLLVYLANIWIVYEETSLINMLLDSLALEYLMILDNQFKEMYFSYLPHAAVDLFDNHFVTHSQNRVLIQTKEKNSRCFWFFKRMTYIPFKILQISLILFPVLCVVVGVYGLFCK